MDGMNNFNIYGLWRCEFLDASLIRNIKPTTRLPFQQALVSHKYHS